MEAILKMQERIQRGAETTCPEALPGPYPEPWKRPPTPPPPQPEPQPEKQAPKQKQAEKPKLPASKLSGDIAEQVELSMMILRQVWAANGSQERIAWVPDFVNAGNGAGMNKDQAASECKQFGNSSYKRFNETGDKDAARESRMWFTTGILLLDEKHGECGSITAISKEDLTLQSQLYSNRAMVQMLLGSEGGAGLALCDAIRATIFAPRGTYKPHYRALKAAVELNEFLIAELFAVEGKKIDGAAADEHFMGLTKQVEQVLHPAPAAPAAQPAAKQSAKRPKLPDSDLHSYNEKLIQLFDVAVVSANVPNITAVDKHLQEMLTTDYFLRPVGEPQVDLNLITACSFLGQVFNNGEDQKKPGLIKRASNYLGWMLHLMYRSRAKLVGLKAQFVKGNSPAFTINTANSLWLDATMTMSKNCSWHQVTLPPYFIGALEAVSRAKDVNNTWKFFASYLLIVSYQSAPVLQNRDGFEVLQKRLVFHDTCDQTHEAAVSENAQNSDDRIGECLKALSVNAKELRAPLESSISGWSFGR